MQPTLQREKPPARERPGESIADWGAAGWAGLGASLVFMAVEFVLRPGATWMPSRLVAAVALGQMVLQPPAEYASVIHAAALGVHFTLSLLYARMLALIMHRFRMSRAMETGAAFGLGLYLLNFYALSVPFPWLAEARGWVTALAHIAFGTTAAFLYKELETVEGRRR